MKGFFKVDFRLANIYDLDEIMIIYKNVIKNNFTTWDDNYPNNDLIKNDIQNNNLYLLLKDNQIVAVSYLGIYKNKETWKYNFKNPLSIARICVNPFFQGKGYGKLLLDKLIMCARNKGADGLQFHVAKLNKTAIKMYESLNFENTGNGIIDYGFEFYKFEMQI